MELSSNVLKNEERAVFELRSLYKKYGYLPYKMSKFEEYDLYVRNKSFLISDNIITFTDSDGRLVALKPDVTLSIIKNCRDSEDSVQKVCYNENVYRVSKSTNAFKEIMQVGLECIGNVDDYQIYEVILLAAQSLEKISDNFVLEISHLDIVRSVIEKMPLSSASKKLIFEKIGQKNIHDIQNICNQENCDCTELKSILSTYGTPDKVIEKLETLNIPETKDYILSLTKTLQLLRKTGIYEKIRIDFSATSDMNYYNGFVFKGFIDGIASSVLSGGQYDNLMQKMHKKSKAIGFAVYLDMIERLDKSEQGYDVDSLILYDETSDLSAIADAVKLFSDNGKTVMVQKSIPEKIKYRQLLKIGEKGVEILENNA